MTSAVGFRSTGVSTVKIHLAIAPVRFETIIVYVANGLRMWSGASAKNAFTRERGFSFQLSYGDWLRATYQEGPPIQWGIPKQHEKGLPPLLIGANITFINVAAAESSECRSKDCTTLRRGVHV